MKKVAFKNVSDIKRRMLGCGCRDFEPGEIAEIEERLVGEVDRKFWQEVVENDTFSRDEAKEAAAARRKSKPAKVEGK